MYCTYHGPHSPLVSHAGRIPRGAGLVQYIVRLTQAAERVFQTLEFSDQQELDRALADELADGPNADKEIRFDADGGFQVYTDPDLPGDAVSYTATPLSFKAYTAIHRP